MRELLILLDWVSRFVVRFLLNGNVAWLGWASLYFAESRQNSVCNLKERVVACNGCSKNSLQGNRIDTNRESSEFLVFSLIFTSITTCLTMVFFESPVSVLEKNVCGGRGLLHYNVTFGCHTKFLLIFIE